MGNELPVRVTRSNETLPAVRVDVLAVFFAAMRDVAPLPRILAELDDLIGGVSGLRHVPYSRAQHLPETRLLRSRLGTRVVVGTLGLRGLVTVHDYIRAGASLARNVMGVGASSVAVALVEADTVVIGTAGDVVETGFLAGFKQELFVCGAKDRVVELTMIGGDDDRQSFVRPRIPQPA